MPDTARAWNEGDPQPADCHAVVDDEGNTWLYTEDPWDDGSTVHFGWVRQRFEHHPGKDGNPGIVVGGQIEDEWSELVATYGPLREATGEEARSATLVLSSTEGE